MPYENQYVKHPIKSEELTLYRNAYSDDTRESGFFVDVAEEIKKAKSHIIINGWAVENIPIGHSGDDVGNVQDPYRRKMLATLLIEKAMEFHDSLQSPSVLILIQSWNHALDGGKSNEFGDALAAAALSYFQAHRIEIENELESRNEQLSSMKQLLAQSGPEQEIKLDPQAIDRIRKKIKFLEERIQALEKIKKGEIPLNLIWRANSGRNGDLTNSNHQKSVSIDGKIVFTGGLDLAFGRDYPANYPDVKVIKKGEPIFRDGATKTENQEAAQDVENSAFALALSKMRKKEFISSLNPLSAQRLHSDEDASRYLADRIEDIVTHRVKNPESVVEESSATWQLLRTVPKGLMYNDAISLALSKEESKSSLLHKNPDFPEIGIKDAYVDVIKSAKKFIYIENQNFTTENIASLNSIPRILANKILKEHSRRNADFHVYITLPRYPVLETDAPDNLQVKLLASAQQDTIESFYTILEERGIPNPSKYVTFSTQIKVEEDDLAQVYNHSKLIITDKSCIQGSANISDRSMNGQRDSEHVVRIDYNADEKVKTKYMNYLLDLLKTNMGDAFLQSFVKENSKFLIEKGYVRTDDNGESFIILSIENIIFLDDFRFAWQQFLAINQIYIDEAPPRAGQTLSLPHSYIKSALIDAVKSGIHLMKSGSESSDLDLAVSDSDVESSPERVSVLFLPSKNPSDGTKSKVNESPESSKELRAAIKSITNLHR